MGSVAKSYMRKGFLIYEEVRKYLAVYEEANSHIWLCNRSLLNFLIFEENLIIFFISARCSRQFRYLFSSNRIFSTVSLENASSRWRIVIIPLYIFDTDVELCTLSFSQSYPPVTVYSNADSPQQRRRRYNVIYQSGADPRWLRSTPPYPCTLVSTKHDPDNVICTPHLQLCNFMPIFHFIGNLNLSHK